MRGHFLSQTRRLNRHYQSGYVNPVVWSTDWTQRSLRTLMSGYSIGRTYTPFYNAPYTNLIGHSLLIEMRYGGSYSSTPFVFRDSPLRGYDFYISITDVVGNVELDTRSVAVMSAPNILAYQTGTFTLYDRQNGYVDSGYTVTIKKWIDGAIEITSDYTGSIYSIEIDVIVNEVGAPYFTNRSILYQR